MRGRGTRLNPRLGTGQQPVPALGAMGAGWHPETLTRGDVPVLGVAVLWGMQRPGTQAVLLYAVAAAGGDLGQLTRRETGRSRSHTTGFALRLKKPPSSKL